MDNSQIILLFILVILFYGLHFSLIYGKIDGKGRNNISISVYLVFLGLAYIQSNDLAILLLLTTIRKAQRVKLPSIFVTLLNVLDIFHLLKKEAPQYVTKFLTTQRVNSA